MKAQHLIADLRCDRHLNEPASVAAFMRAVIVVSGLHTRHFHIERFTEENEFGPGVTGVAVLSESHLAVHTAPERERMNIDLFSCQVFDADQVWQEVAYRFGIQATILWTVIERA